MSQQLKSKMSLWACVFGLSLSTAGCGSMYSYYSLGDAATLKTNGVLTTMDADTRTRNAGVFYIKPGSRIIGLRSDDNVAKRTLIILEVIPNRHYRVDFDSTAGAGGDWVVSEKSGVVPPEYRTCDLELACKTNEPFDLCVRRHC